MKIKPNYFDKFSCIKGDCKNSCCSAGWQIHVDTKTLQKYSSSRDDFLQDTTNYIDVDNNKRFFKLNEQKRCSFLSKDGLCALVTKYGDGYLCDVCRDYPRFYNFFSNRTEMGLSLDCEAVSKMVLSQTEKFSLIADSKHIKFTKQEEVDFKQREQIFQILQNSDDFSSKLNDICNIFSIENKFNLETMLTLIKKFEWLNFDSSEVFDKIERSKDKTNFYLSESILQNLMSYFVYRYFLNSSYKYSKKSKLQFCMFMLWLIDIVAYAEKTNIIEDVIFVVQKICRQIEYSEKNVNLALSFFQTNK